jgi:glycosyltransferase involved in cell wall biosynthesis
MSDGAAMRLVVASHYFESHRGGVEIVAGQLARELERLGIIVTWLAADASAAPAAVEGCGRAVPLPAVNASERWLGVPFPLPRPAAVKSIWREVAAADAVLIHDSLYPTSIVARLAARFFRKPCVIVQHIGIVPYRSAVLRGAMRLANFCLVRPMLARADQVVFISEVTVRYFGSVRYRRPPRLVFNGVDRSVFKPPAAAADREALRRRLALPADGQVALFVGRFVEKKGLPVVEQLARMAPHVTWALAGWGPLSPARWGLGNVRVFSNLEGAALAALYQASDAFVLPSVGEGMPLVVQEALACGLPVVCGSETAEADAELAPLVRGVWVDTADPVATAARFWPTIATVLSRAPSDQDVQGRVAYVARRYDWSRAAADYRDLLVDLTREHALHPEPVLTAR